MSKDLYDAHIKVGEQNIDNEVYEDTMLKGKLSYPAIKITTVSQISKHSYHAIKNSFDLKNGSHFLYVSVNGKLVCIGKIDLNIANIHRLENLLRRLKPVIAVKENEESDYREVKSSELVNTIELKLNSYYI